MRCWGSCTSINPGAARAADVRQAAARLAYPVAFQHLGRLSPAASMTRRDEGCSFPLRGAWAVGPSFRVPSWALE